MLAEQAYLSASPALYSSAQLSPVLVVVGYSSAPGRQSLRKLLWTALFISYDRISHSSEYSPIVRT